MKKTTHYIFLLLAAFCMQNMVAQEEIKTKIDVLLKEKEQIKVYEKEALKIEIEAIAKRLDKNEITSLDAQNLKKEAAKKRALNIENRIAIIDNKISLLERNGTDKLATLDSLGTKMGVDIFDIKINDKSLFYVSKDKEEVKYDIRTKSDFVWAVGLNNAIVDGQSLDDSPYKIGGSRFFEMGVTWRTRLFKNSNAVRLHYGFSFQFNGLKPEGNQYFVENDDQTELQEFEYDLDKSKLRMDNLVFPVHFEFGSSNKVETENTMRYYLDKKFRFGIGAYGGFNIGTRQKLKYKENGKKVKDKFKRDYNTSDLIYGLSAYAGVGETLLYIKYDLNPIFKDALVEQHNISLGLRFDL
ncbi:hypothetical protein [Cellulophaga fucicola]|uniref:Outer membrane protein beta-barrel domain-containing protein n=1 Tax=Cellulophaga fucicola TaxID=76595 RepID=A0A1K1PB77_9FLAO|nr:hypothetical protein [Cellulophaga fucicola]SFW43942.1 hypothetical protein SAMN05660313_01688 [Cellulophaga fucicola]